MHKESKTVQIGIKHYCEYCGALAKEDLEYYGDRDFEDFYYCDSCETGKAEVKMHEEIAKVIEKYGGMDYFESKKNHRIISKLKYEYELEMLNNKYNFYESIRDKNI